MVLPILRGQKVFNERFGSSRLVPVDRIECAEFTTFCPFALERVCVSVLYLATQLSESEQESPR